jgi:hypothetical protein
VAGEDVSARAGPRATLSLRVWGYYLAAIGGILIGAPNTLLGIVGLPTTEEVWIRVVGMLVWILAYASFQSARTGNREYMTWSRNGRFAVPFFFAAFVLFGFVGPQILPFGVIDLAGATWTWWAIRADAAA